jgi:metallophosphoesterase (TIGR03767 family)
MPETHKSRIIRGEKSATSNWNPLIFAPGEAPIGEAPQIEQVLASFIHLSDLHICDAASPARLEFLDRIADPDNPLSALVPYVGTYRAQEFLTTQVLESMVQAVNEIKSGPLLNSPISAVIITGDVIDNAQKNELEWYQALLEGKEVNPASGSTERQSGPFVSDPETFDIHYYHPDGAPAEMEEDRPHSLHGFPIYKGVTAGALAPFKATGLIHPWFAIHGNHDALLQGTAVPTIDLDKLATGSAKLVGLQEGADLQELFGAFGEIGPAVYPGIEALLTTETNADSRRALVAIEDWVRVHTECGHDHGLSAEENQISYWSREIGENILLVALDTVNRFGGWQGCIHREQFEWLKNLLKKSTGKYVVLTSHHPLENLFNGYVPETESAPALEAEVCELLEQYPNVIAWVSGHVHDHRISERMTSSGAHMFWEIRTGSHIDWPQQSRSIEFARTIDGRIVIGTVLIDHKGPIEFNGTPGENSSPVALSGLSRQLAANDWQRQTGNFALELAEGAPSDRNIWLYAEDPLR